jgi:hypothetical protein
VSSLRTEITAYLSNRGPREYAQQTVALDGPRTASCNERTKARLAPAAVAPIRQENKLLMPAAFSPVR